MTSEKVALLMENNEVKQFAVNRTSQKSQVGNLYIGRIRRIDHGLQSAFVDIGDKKLAFLSKKEIPMSRKNPKEPIEKIIHEGMAMLVQVVKDAYDNKGPKVTANVTIPGHYFIFMPYGNYIAASKKMDGDKRNHLLNLVNTWKQHNEGAIIRTSAIHVEESLLMEEWKRLQQKWEQIEQSSRQLKIPSCLFEDQEVPDRFLRKYALSSMDKIIFDEVKVSERMKDEFPHLANKIRWTDRFSKELPINFSHLIEKITSRVVKLSSGVELIIEKTEAFTTIDINTSSYVGKLNKEQTILHANVEAAKEIAKQLRLRNLAGIILIDFIDMKDEKNKNHVIKEMKKLCSDDPTYCEVHGFTSLGILELTRKREGVDSFSLFCEPIGYQLSPLYYAYELERELLLNRKKDYEAFLVEVDERVFDVFVKTIDIAALKENMKTPIYMEKKTVGQRGFVIKFIGDLKWLHSNDGTSGAIDKRIQL